MRIDHKLAEGWIKPNAKVLDLGCGDGSLLAHLQSDLGVFGYGIEMNQDNINTCIKKGINVIEQDLNDGLGQFGDNSFDVVLMTRALQAVKNPKALLLDMLRVAKVGIITFPNFAYWQNRVSLGVKGIMPMSETLPHQWYDTPNIHLCTFKDFERLCKDNGIAILDTVAVSDTPLPARLPKVVHPFLQQAEKRLVQKIPNFFADVAVYRITKI